MLIRITSLAALIATIAMMATAQASPTTANYPINATHSIDASTPPPTEPIYEVTPGERPGYAWVAGYWGWNGKDHVWQSGRWIKDRPGYAWVCESWAQRGKKWHLYPGHWEIEAMDAEADDTSSTADNAANTTETAVPLKKPLAHAKKHRKPIDYTNKNLWPRYIGR